MNYFTILFGNTKRSIKILALCSFLIAILGAFMPFVLLIFILLGDGSLNLMYIYNTILDSRHLSSLQNSFFLSLVTAFILTFLSCLFALFFRRIDLTGNKLIYGLAIIPAFIPDQIFGVAGRMIFDPTIGLFSEILPKSILIGRYSSLLLVTLVLLMKWLPLMIILCDSMINTIPNDLFYSTIMDHKLFADQIRFTYLPYIKEILVMIFAIMFLIGFRQHELAFELTSSSGGLVSETWSLWNYKQIFEFNQLGKAAIEALTVLFLLLIPILVIKNQSQKIA